MTPVGLIILAAGASRRMGAPKQLLRNREGRSLLQSAAAAAIGSRCRPLVAVLGAASEAAEDELTGLPLRTVFNSNWQSGMASSVKVGLDALADEGAVKAAVIMLCDQPLVTAGLLDSLVAAWTATSQEIIACEYGGIVGVPALFGRTLFPALRELQGEAGARHVIRAYSGNITRIPFPGGMLDIDTPEDFLDSLQRNNTPSERI